MQKLLAAHNDGKPVWNSYVGSGLYQASVFMSRVSTCLCIPEMQTESEREKLCKPPPGITVLLSILAIDSKRSPMQSSLRETGIIQTHMKNLSSASLYAGFCRKGLKATDVKPASSSEVSVLRVAKNQSFHSSCHLRYRCAGISFQRRRQLLSG